MRRQRGSLLIYGALAAGAVMLVMGIALKVQSSRLASVKQEYAGFQAQVKAVGEVAEAKAKAKEKADLEAKRRIDNENKTLRANLAAESKRLREFNARSSAVSRLPAGTNRPDLACFDRAELDKAVGRYQSDLLGIAEKGATAALDLDTCKAWIKDISAK